MMLIGVGPLAAGDNRGSCPFMPPVMQSELADIKAAASPTPPDPDSQYAGTVWLRVLLSTKGFVCDAQVIRSLDKETDEKSLKAVRDWHFDAAKKNGHAVAVLVRVEISYWRKNGELIQFPAAPILAPTPSGPEPQK